MISQSIYYVINILMFLKMRHTDEKMRLRPGQNAVLRPLVLLARYKTVYRCPREPARGQTPYPVLSRELTSTAAFDPYV